VAGGGEPRVCAMAPERTRACAQTQRSAVSAPLQLGERVLLIDVKRRRYLVVLAEGGEFHSHAGFVAHDDVVGAREGTVVRSTKGAEYTVLRPTLEDFVVEMPRGAQVIYPKDLAPICMLADIGPGLRVFESGVGSGAMSMTMLRWGAEIVGYELRQDFANRARANVRSFLGPAMLERYSVELRDTYEGIDGGPFDRVVLDLPEPWRVVPHAERVLHAGGILVAYTPSIIQAARTREELKGTWIDARTIEVLHRGWHIDGHAVRPDHRMVAHTGFLTAARYLGARRRLLHEHDHDDRDRS
jgi:tRNA (adenine57-N1/adenine58-N1)-methyltransferase catalytic subunit